MVAPEIARLKRTLWTHMEPGEALYAVLDGAQDDRIYPNLSLSTLRHTCLYLGDIPEELAAAAPHLTELRETDRSTDWILEQGWSANWGIACITTASLPELARHFRRFLLVRDESGRQLYFRYYDPRILSAYLPTCTPDELQTVFGPVRRFIASDGEAGTYSVFSLRTDAAGTFEMTTDTVALEAAPSPLRS